MTESNTGVLNSWSNGRWLHLDLESNSYLAGEPEDNPALELARVAAAAQLHDCLREPASVLPSVDMVKHYLRSAWLAWRVRREPIIQQVQRLQAIGGKSKPRVASTTDTERCAVMYQHLRDLRLRRPACLEDSIGCALFLHRYVAPVSFHIGVMQPPFKAHAWVQSGELIANDTKHAVEDYSEILRLDL